MRKKLRLAIGFLSFWPYIYILFLFGYVTINALYVDQKKFGESVLSQGMQVGINALNLATSFEVLCIITLFLMHLYKKDDLSKEKKTMWALLLLLGNMFVLPIYWVYFYKNDIQEEDKK